MAGTVRSRLRSCYENLLEATESVALQANEIVRRPQNVSGRFRHANNRVTFECFVVLENWSARSSSAKERVTIVVRAQEEMSVTGDTLYQSTVGVSYFEPADGGARLLHTVHFDFGPQQRCHPTFHAQLTKEPVIPSEEEKTELRCEVTFLPENGCCFKNARIPTSDMTLASVLLCLFADHIKDEIFAEYKRRIREIQQAMPRPNYDAAMQDSLKADLTRLGSSHWFAHIV